jgi:hypothetical protein
VGVVKRRVLQGLWRRLVGVGIIGTGLSGSGFYTVLGRAVFTPFPHRIWRGLRFARLYVARDLGWCDHETIPGGTRTPHQVQLQPPCSAHRLLS